MPPSDITPEHIEKFDTAYQAEKSKGNSYRVTAGELRAFVERFETLDVRRALERHSKILTSSEILGQWSGLEWITVSQTCHACGHVTKRVFSNADKIRCACCNQIQPTENTMQEHMNFGMALDALKRGTKVQREGWNGKGMWVVLIHPGNSMHTSSAGSFDMQPCIGMKTAGGNMQPGWLASQADMLADDWSVVT